jgi:GH15 family glucan-1,4-alpha-glucosidase
MDRLDVYTASVGEYAVLSYNRTAALVAADGAVDWLCAPRFDGDPLCSRLLDAERGGVFELQPVEPFAVERAYVEDTNLLQTTWTTASGTVRVTDALVVAAGIQHFSELLRRVECLAGSMELTWRVAPRFGWAREVGSLRREQAGYVLCHGSLEVLIQSFDCGDAVPGDGEVSGRLALTRGDTGVLAVLIVEDSPPLGCTREQSERRLEETAEHWRAWLRPLAYDGPWKEQVRRGALALAACTHDTTGALVAAPTTSLPERVGGDRNYDYRYCWVRDTSFALEATLHLGLTQLAQATLGWLLRASRRTHPRVNVFFTLDGEPFAPEEDLELPGWRGSRPVRRGNDAGEQLQLGCFSELLETAWLFVESGSPLDEYSGLHLGEVADHICHIWRNRDSGIWEEREDLRHYTGSKVGCWTALDRALKLHAAGQLGAGDPERWRTDMTAIRAWVEEHCRTPDGVFLRDGDGGDALDAAALLLAKRGFVGDTDPGFTRTVDRITDELGAGGGLLFRNRDMAGEENAFLACSYWLVEALARRGDVEDAAALMDQLGTYANDVGLLAEEVDPSDGSPVGNFPQCFSHLALLNAAVVLAECEDGGRAAQG